MEQSFDYVFNNIQIDKSTPLNNIYQSLLDCYTAYLNLYQHRTINSNFQIYHVCINKMQEIGYFHKLFYFQLVDINDINFLQLFEKFIPMFLSNKYDKCWQFDNLLVQKSYSFFQKYIDKYIQIKGLSSNIINVQQKFRYMMLNSKYQYKPFKLIDPPHIL